MSGQRAMPSVRPLRAHDPTSIGPYELQGRIGEGGMGTVYLGRGPEGQTVAVKLVRPELTDDSAFIARFRSEVANARRVASFSTAQVLDHGEEFGRAYLVTEYIDGPSLGQYIAENGELTPGLLYGVAVGVAAALVAIHGAGLIHRDLKPANVLLSLSGPRVIDFGIARALDEMGGRLTMTGQLVGSPGWIAPEQMAGGQVTTAVDIFTWGCLVAFAGNARHPFGTGDFPLMAMRIAQAEPDLGSLPAPLDRLVAAALAKDPGERPTAQDLLLALVGGTPGTGPGAAPVPSGSAQGDAGPSGPAGSGALAGAVGSAGAGAAPGTAPMTEPFGAADAALPETVAHPGGAAARDAGANGAGPDGGRSPIEDRRTTEPPAGPAAPAESATESAAGPAAGRAAQAGSAGPADHVAPPVVSAAAGSSASPNVTARDGESVAQETIADTWRPEELRQAGRAPDRAEAAAGPAPGPAIETSRDAVDRAAHDAPTVRAEPLPHPPSPAVVGFASAPPGTVASGLPPTAPSGLPGGPLAADAPGHGKHGRRPALMAGGLAVALLLVAVPLALLALRDEETPQRKPTDPNALPADAMLVRMDRGLGWPKQCLGNVGIVEPGKSEPKVLLPGEQCDILPHWSPKRDKIAFTRVTGTTSALWTMNADGSGATKVVDDIAYKTRVTWSRDGKRIAFMRTVAGNSEIFVITLGESTPQQLTFTTAKEDDPIWSPKADRIAFWSDREGGKHQIFTLSVADPKAAWVQVTHDDNDAGDPVWSPDGRKIAFTGKVTGTDRDVYVTDASGTGKPVQLTSGPQNDMDPNYAPNGKWIAFVRGPVEKPGVWAVRADGEGDPIRVTPQEQYIGHPNWT